MVTLGEDRIGPNQDINSRNTIEETSFYFNKISQNMGNLIEILDTENIFASGEKIINITIPLKLNTGETISFDTSPPGAFVDEIWSKALIHTYIGLAEVFRDYWNILNDTLQSIDSSGFTYIESVDFDEEDYFLDGTRYFLYQFEVILPGPFTEPEWTGFGPINYNYNTYPQLITTIQTLDPYYGIDLPLYLIFPIDLLETWDTIYTSHIDTDDTGASVGCSVSIGGSQEIAGEGSIFEFDDEFFIKHVQIYNDGDMDLDISFSASISITASSGIGPINGSVQSIAEIKDRNDYPVTIPNNPLISLFPSFQSQSVSLDINGGTVSTELDRIVTVPPNKSVFIYAIAGGGTTFFEQGVDILQIFASVTVNGRTRSNSLSLGV